MTFWWQCTHSTGKRKWKDREGWQRMALYGLARVITVLLSLFHKNSWITYSSIYVGVTIFSFPKMRTLGPVTKNFNTACLKKTLTYLNDAFSVGLMNGKKKLSYRLLQVNTWKNKIKYYRMVGQPNLCWGT